jgi:hypothetical protein
MVYSEVVRDLYVVSCRVEVETVVEAMRDGIVQVECADWREVCTMSKDWYYTMMIQKEEARDVSMSNVGWLKMSKGVKYTRNECATVL